MNTQNPNVQVIPFVADSAEDAVAQIRTRLGPDAVVVNVRQVPADGLSKLWKAPRIEVLAYKPDVKIAAIAPDPLAELKQELLLIKQQLAPSAATDSSLITSYSSRSRAARSAGTPTWRAAEVLETSGLMPVHAQRVLEQLQARHGDLPPATLSEELVLTRTTLANLWPALSETARQDRGTHVLVGPAGAGKTTCICKWLAQARLVQGRSANVWRLDGVTANTAESLSVYCEILGVPAERTWTKESSESTADLNFIDLPGVDWRNPGAVRELKRLLEENKSWRVHLVLNAAYETPLLVAQARAFAELQVEDLILTHLDEEPRWGKIWNVVLGTNYPVRFLSAAQNVPGEFLPATAERILARQFAA